MSLESSQPSDSLNFHQHGDGGDPDGVCFKGLFHMGQDEEPVGLPAGRKAQVEKHLSQQSYDSAVFLLRMEVAAYANRGDTADISFRL